MAKIIYQPFVIYKLNDLVDNLFDVKYFATKENAVEYVEALRAFIRTIPEQRHRPTKNKEYGTFYCEYRPNKKTSWFITFDKEEDVFLIKNLINNHTKDYPMFIRVIK